MTYQTAVGISFSLFYICYLAGIESVPIEYANLKHEDLMCYQPKTQEEVWICYNKNTYAPPSDEKSQLLKRINPVDIEWKLLSGNEGHKEQIEMDVKKRDYYERLARLKPIDQYLMLRGILRKIKANEHSRPYSAIKKRPFDSISYGSVFGGFG